jgi:hypothetical protein
VLVGSLAVALGYSVIRWSVKAGNEEMTFVGYQAVRVTEAEAVTDGDIRRPVAGEDRCFLTLPPCSPYGASDEGKFGAYVIYLPPD